MLFCFPSLHRRSKAKKTSHQISPNPESETIEIRVVSESSPKKWEFAEMSFETNSDANIISQRLLEKVLGEPIPPVPKESSGWEGTATGDEQEAHGSVEVEWCFEKSPRKIYGPARFVVSSTYDPPYDALLGRRDSLYYGIISAKDAS